MIMFVQCGLCINDSCMIGCFVKCCDSVIRIILVNDMMFSVMIICDLNQCLCWFFLSMMVSELRLIVRLKMLSQFVLKNVFQCGWFDGSLNISSVISSRYMGRFRKKYQFQFMFFVSQLFSIGLNSGLSSMIRLNSVILIGNCDSGRCVWMMVCVVGISVLFVKFWLIWLVIIIGSECDQLYIIENVMNSVEFVSRKLCNLNMCVSQVVSGIIMIFDIRQLVEIYVFLVLVVLILFWICGSVEFVIEMLSVVISVLSVLVVIVIQLVMFVWFLCGGVGIVVGVLVMMLFVVGGVCIDVDCY